MLPKNSTVHLLWIIAILIAVVSVLMWKMPNGDSLSGYISFAASIASLVLAVVAIFQSILSSNSLSSTILAINDSSRQIIAETTRLQGATLELSEEASKTIAELGNLPKDIGEFRGEVSQKLDRLEFAKAPAQLAQMEGDGDKIYRKGSYLWGLSFYTLAVSRKTGKTFDVDAMLAAENRTQPRFYMTGFFDVIKRFKVCNIEIDGVAGKYFATSLGTLNADEILDYFESIKIEPGAVKETFKEIAIYFSRDVIWPLASELEGQEEVDVSQSNTTD